MRNSLKQTEDPFTKLNKPFQESIKRIVDIIGSTIALIIFSPIFVVIALLIICEDGRPVFFKQKRSGLYDNAFSMYKFRSMRVRSTPRSKDKSSSSKYNWTTGVPDNFVFKTASEANPNITKMGHFIRKYSLDELPQFINVLKGEMSLIGPRPEIIEITRCYSTEQKMRLTVKPGITGWAQTNGRSNMNHGEKIRCDLYYVNNFNLWLDLKVILKTAVQVVAGKGSV
ncbi:sugar transferase [Halobacillus shinanisalinarum]|uniref:Sugar transferase n=1 Tax=Halobacillus shinanisalinarum TaxID=2932258 RepID=A0ABY4H4N0_9BACI|nr:sugar transferase [Halobacillus shinanisalinarum]UOQ95055.1 sugar transferase [Halobacillus shinanisalinarum]